jgi:hypothetical protein
MTHELRYDAKSSEATQLVRGAQQRGLLDGPARGVV